VEAVEAVVVMVLTVRAVEEAVHILRVLWL
jgi:hypothetical protein